MTGNDWLTCDVFARHVGERFDVTPQGATAAFTMRLLEATEGTEPGGHGPGGEERVQFSLVFRGPVGPVLPQGTFRVTHEQLGELELFLVPIARDDDGARYEAAFA